ncbi:MAG: hypothetical protein HC923_05090 [Myxococcales bacterium]|nr:hypothetical protein [Myxococcales bacterium]
MVRPVDKSFQRGLGWGLTIGGIVAAAVGSVLVQVALIDRESETFGDVRVDDDPDGGLLAAGVASLIGGGALIVGGVLNLNQGDRTEVSVRSP